MLALHVDTAHFLSGYLHMGCGIGGLLNLKQDGQAESE